MKKFREAAIAFLCAVCLAGCGVAGADSGQPGENEESDTGNLREVSGTSDAEESGPLGKSWDVSVISKGEVYFPVENFTYAECVLTDEHGERYEVSECGAWLEPEDVKMMPRVPWDEEMHLDSTGRVISYSCGFYNKNYEKFEEKSGEGNALSGDGTQEEENETLASIIFPRAEEAYYVKLSVSFELPDQKAGYQYFFQVTPGGPSPILSILDRDMEKVTRVPCAKGRGAFSVFLREGTLPYVPIGTRLYLSFSQDRLPVSARIYDLILDGNYIKLETGEIQAQELFINDGAYSVYVGTNMDAFQYKNSNAYKPGGICRGFLLECEFEDEINEQYAIAFRTDAAFGIGEKSSSAYLMPMCGTGIQIFAECFPAEQKSGLTVTFDMENAGSCDFYYGNEVELYCFDGPEQKELPLLPDAAWEDAAYTLKAGKRRKQKINIDQLFGPLRPGYYRLSKKLTNQKDGTVQTVSADFVVNTE